MAEAFIHLNHLALLEFSGEDAAAFLQGQLSSDIRQLQGDVCQLSTYSSPKGRMFASFLAFAEAGNMYLLVARDLADFVLKRLSMFIMRSKVKARLADEFQILGVLEAADAQPWRKCKLGEDILLGLPERRWIRLTRELPADNFISGELSAWILADILQGLPWITAATKEMFVPQMCQFELIGGGVSFKKGCYPGQEIVARSQYLGQVKRRMLPATVDCLEVAAGDALLCEDQAIGHVLTAVKHQNQTFLLAVLQIAKIDAGVYLQQGTPLHFLPLPYDLDQKVTD